MTLNEATEAKKKKPTLLELQEIVQNQQQEIAQLKKENGMLHAQLQTAMEEQRQNAQTIANQKQLIESMEKDVNFPESQNESLTENKASNQNPQSPVRAIWGKSFPYVLPWLLVLLALLSPAFRADAKSFCMMIWFLHDESLSILSAISESATQENRETVFSILTTLFAVCIFAGVFCTAKYLRAQVKDNLPPALKKAAPYIPGVFVFSDFIHMVIPMNVILFVIMLAIGFAAAALFPKGKKKRFKL